MGGDFSVNPGRFGTQREDPSRNLGFTYGSAGPWAGAVFGGLGKALGATSPIGVASMGVQAATGKSLLDHALSAMGINGVGGLLGGNPAASGLTPDQMMAMSARGENYGRGGLLDILGDVLGGGSYGGGSGGGMPGGGFDRGAMG